MCKFESHVTRNDVITKNNGKQFENTDLRGTKQNIYRWKGFNELFKNVIFIEFEPLCQKLWVFMSNLPKPLTQYSHVT